MPLILIFNDMPQRGDQIADLRVLRVNFWNAKKVFRVHEAIVTG